MSPNSLFAQLWQTLLGWLYSLLGGGATPAAAPASAPPAVVVAEREAAAQGAIAQAQAQAPRTDSELEARLAKGDF